MYLKLILEICNNRQLVNCYFYLSISKLNFKVLYVCLIYEHIKELNVYDPGDMELLWAKVKCRYNFLVSKRFTQQSSSYCFRSDSRNRPHRITPISTPSKNCNELVINDLWRVTISVGLKSKS